MSKIPNYYKITAITTILKKFKIENIVISGLKDKKLINELLNYNAKITAINIDVSHPNINNQSGNPFNILQSQRDYEAIFINDDPNWYTTFKELNIIKETTKNFPLIFICNNKFPNKYRDSYSNPETIPKEFINKYEKKLPIKYGNKEIIIEDGFYHACDEKSPKNGVSAAISDFLNENPNISVMEIKFSDEITILYPKSTISTIRINLIKEIIEKDKITDLNITEKIKENEILLRYIDETELSEKQIVADYENKIQIKDSQIQFKDSQIMGINSKLNVKDLKIQDVESKLINKNNEIKNLENSLNNANKKINDLKNELNTEKSVTKNKNADLNFKIKTAKNEIEMLKQNLNTKEKNLSEKTLEFEKKELNLKNQLQTTTDQLQITTDQLQTTSANQLEQINQLDSELKYTKKIFESMKNNQIKQANKLNSKEYCISCYKEEIENNKVEIDYFKGESLIKKILSPLSYFYILLKSKPQEITINFKLFKALKNSKCFDIGYYLNNNNDVKTSKWINYFSPELHYVCKGFNENRKFNKKYFNRTTKKELLNYLITCEDNEYY